MLFCLQETSSEQTFCRNQVFTDAYISLVRFPMSDTNTTQSPARQLSVCSVISFKNLESVFVDLANSQIVFECIFQFKQIHFVSLNFTE